MKNSMKTLLCAVGFAALSAGSAYAQSAPAPDWSLTGSFAGQTDYRFRGISQNAKKGAAQGSLNLSGPDGWYIGTWLSQVDFDPSEGSDNPSLEWDIFGGKHFDLGDSTDLNVEAYYYSYPAAVVPAGSPKVSYVEGIFQLSHTFFGVAATGTYAISPEGSLGGGVTHYLALGLSYPVMDWLSVSGNVGHQWVAAAPTDYTHADFGATATWKSLSLDGRYVTSDIGATNCKFFMATRNACSGGFVATLTYNMALLP